VGLPRDVEIIRQSPRSDKFVELLFYAENCAPFDVVELDYLPNCLSGAKSADDDGSVLLLLLHG
jgi:hypothetical protein